MTAILRIFLTIVAVAGVFFAGRLTMEHFQSGSTCPTIGAIPICAIVLAGYVAILVASLLPAKRMLRLFFLGWIPVAGFAFSGAAMEFIRGDVCPTTSFGAPLCYFSLVGALLLLLLVFTARKER